MAALIDEHGPPPYRRTRNAFQTLARAIIYQQLSGKAAGTIYGRFLALYPGRRFPRPRDVSQTPQSALRQAGLSAQKVTYLRDLAARFCDGTISTRRFARLDDEQLCALLCQVKGIGPWSVDMFLMFGLARPDVLPVGDLGVRRGMMRFFALPALPVAAEMRALADPWRPFRSLASWYMWRVAEGPGSSSPTGKTAPPLDRNLY